MHTDLGYIVMRWSHLDNFGKINCIQSGAVFVVGSFILTGPSITEKIHCPLTRARADHHFHDP